MVLTGRGYSGIANQVRSSENNQTLQSIDMRKATLFTAVLFGLIWLSACYKNYYDIPEDTLNEINSVSFRNDVVPIMTSGACGCHNNGTNSQIKFSWNDTIYYSAIQARAGMLNDMANGGAHPGEGSIFFTPSQASIVRKWYSQGAKDDYTPPPITGPVTYDKNIFPIYRTDCTGSTCHGGSAVTLDYNAMRADSLTIKRMMSSGGQAGHPGGPFPIATTTSSTFLAWYAQGAPKN